MPVHGHGISAVLSDRGVLMREISRLADNAGTAVTGEGYGSRMSP
jgi:hypothetical protein